MKVHLMSRDRDFVADNVLPSHAPDLEQDLGLNTVYAAMARGDQLVHDVVRKALVCSMQDVDAIRYRQHVLADCLQAPDVVLEMYRLVLDTLETRRKNWLGVFTRTPSGIVHEAVNLLKLLISALMRLRQFADTQGERFQSEGFTAFWAALRQELDDAYFARVQEQIGYLGRPEILVRAELGRDQRGSHYTLVRGPKGDPGVLGRVLALRAPGYTLHVDPRDDAGNRTLEHLKDAALNPAANALAQSAEHILAFFEQLKTELAFFVGCLNVHQELKDKGEPWCMPEPFGSDQRVRHCRGLYDPALTLHIDDRVVGNDLDADGTDLIIVTGANQGGKSTFLRSLGIAQLMMQSGMFVPAETFAANVCDGLFTHFRREEDAEMQSGKLDEELRRMSAVADHIRPHSLILFNESFASTNEREGSELFRQITEALLECRVQVVSVSHLYPYAQAFCVPNMRNAVFLRAERERTFKLKPGGPMTTSFGRDLYERIFKQSVTSTTDTAR